MLFKTKEALHDAVIRMAFACVASLDNQGNIVEFHSYLDKIPNSTGPSFIGQPWQDIFVPEKKDKGNDTLFTDLVSPGRRTGSPAPKVLTAYDNRLFIEWAFLRVAASDQTAEGILGVGTDVTRHMELERQLHHADRLAKIGQLSAGVAHELNGPLNNILGYAQLSAKQQDLPEQVYQDLDNIIRFSLHAREIVKKVMLFSRQVPAGREPVDLNRVIQESLYFTEPLSNRKKIRVSCDFAKDLPAIKGDFSQLRQVVVNLVVNAAQAIGDNGGDITLQTLAGPGQTITMTITDTGQGMSADTLEQCFLPFFTTKDVDQGTGLGLSVVHGIIQSHNGEITAHSQPGKGSRFHVVFPSQPDKGDRDA